ncbi:MAG: c-type cytochrome [Magnetovibrio sp.]|nr:c-type cytochrome [Magnetovibrio sp.]MDD9904695.1 c-type cytochrome [Rhodospirillaceae bacterium]
MANRKPIFLAAAILAAGFAGPAPAADMASSVVLANTCFSCHGTDGHSAGAMPSINGKPAKYIASQMKAFRDGKKQSTVMQRIAKGFGDKEIESLAQYFAKNPN